MKNREIADLFEAIADLLELSGGNVFKVGSYRKASRVVGDLPDDIAALAEAGKLTTLPGIGKSTAQHIEEYLATGVMTRHQELAERIPGGVVAMMHVQGIGPKTAGLLYEKAAIETVQQLADAIDEGRLTDLPGLGPKKLENMRKGIATYLGGQGRILLGEALAVAEQLVELLREATGARDIVPAGSLRRRRETVGDIDILISASRGKAVVDAFVGLPLVAEVLAAGETKGSVRVEGGLQVDLRVVPPESFGAAAQYFTGSRDHNVRLRELAIEKKLKLNEYGLFKGEKRIAGATEEEIYEALGLDWIPPELREDRGEIEAAAKHALPQLIELGDVRGDLHMHSTHSDGSASIEDMAHVAMALGHSYICITDHSQSLHIANGLSPERLAAQCKAIERLNRKLEGFRILAGCEVDILSDGTLDMPDGILAKLDFAVASIHTGMGQDADRITHRIIQAMQSPRIHAIAHPTGRILGHRDVYAHDFGRIVKAAKATGTALEINCHYQRLDLNDVHARAARDAGVKLVLGTDAHDPLSLRMMRLGVAVARRGWARPSDVLNTLPVEDLLAWTRRKQKS